jgi:hypothetical protein
VPAACTAADDREERDQENASHRAVRSISPNALPDDHRDGHEDRGDEDRNGDVPFWSSAGKSTSGVRRSMMRYDTNMMTTPMMAYKRSTR